MIGYKMKITIFDKLLLMLEIYKIILRRNIKLKQKLYLLINPIDATRYIEFCFLLKAIKKHKINLKNQLILDVSSPYILAYIFSEFARVTKTDISKNEEKFIRVSNNLSFKMENSTSLSFREKQFYFTYSISVIEHIYRDYYLAISEMIRATKESGFIYVTFPISREYREEWLKSDLYGHQHKDKRGVFFQYIFNEKHSENITKFIKRKSEIIDYGFYFEKKDGGYDKLVTFLKKNKMFNIIKNSFANFWYGLFNLQPMPENFSVGKGIGVACILARKN